MFLKKIFPHQALNKAYRKVKPSRDEFDPFQKNLEKLLDQTNDTESEEHQMDMKSYLSSDTNKLEVEITIVEVSVR